MPDPGEGVAADGTIRTGARRDRVPAVFEPVLADAVAMTAGSGASLYVYGSVANGTARPGESDVDLLSVGLPGATAVSQRLTARYAGLCRGVEIAPSSRADLDGESDEAYGFAVFLRHYCVHLSGPDPSAALTAFRADTRAARGFNGDIGASLARWREQLAAGAVPASSLGARAARKSLLALAGLVSVHDRTWTTSRPRAARRWGEIESALAPALDQLLSWAQRDHAASRAQAEAALASDGIVAAITGRFAARVGLWPE